MHKSNSFDIGDRFKQVRTKLGLNQTQFADKIRMQQSAVSAIEKGERLPTTDQLVIVSNTFGVTTDWLLFGEEPVIVSEPPTEYSPEVKELLHILEEVPTIRKSIEAMAQLPERDQIIHLGEMLKNLKELEDK